MPLWRLAALPFNVKIVPNVPVAPNRLVAILVHEGLSAFEFGIAAEIFGLERPEMGPDWYRAIVCAETQGPLRGSVGLTVTTEAGLECLAEAGTIVIAGWHADGRQPSDALRQAIIEAHGQGARVVTLCSGAFLAAALGLLDGRRATTHWRYAQDLGERHPEIEVIPDVLYVDEDDVLTSAGSAAGIDLLLHVVRKDFGADAANRVARRLVMPAHRDGGQAQYVERPVSRHADGRLAPLLDTVRARPGETWSVGRLAAEAAMSERTFLRRFRDMTGTTPGAWIQDVRIDAARHLLETQTMAMGEVAATAGFGSLASLRHHFRRSLGISPTTYRARFSHARRS